MIEEDTLFILGAGASFPYGFPTGIQLRELICKRFPAQLKDVLEATSSTPRNLSMSVDKAKRFSEEFSKSSTPSIDLFLSRRREFEDTGKKAISLFLLKAEKESVFNEDISEGIRDSDWYSILYHRMTENITDMKDIEVFKRNKIKFITFNYDRSLEYYLSESLTHSFGLDHRSVTELMDSLTIIHVYGSLGELWSGGQSNVIMYGNQYEEVGNELINLVSTNIRTLYEGMSDANDPIVQMVRNARRIFFLGFGYAKENLEKMGIPDEISDANKIFGTAYGLTEKEIEDTRQETSRNFMTKPSGKHSFPRIENTDSAGLLKKYL